MRALHINTERTWRGGERQTLYLLQGLAEQGVDSALLARAGFPLAIKAQAAGIEVYEVPSQGAALAWLTRHGRGFDLLHAHTAKGHSLAVLTGPLHRRPVVATRRVDFVPSGLPARLKYARTDRVVAISPAIAKVLRASGMVPARRPIPVIPSAVRPTPQKKAPETVREQLGVGDGPLVGTVAALVPHKDPATLLQAAKLVLQARPSVSFVHCGDGDLLAETRQRAAALGIADRYLLPGFCDHPLDVIRALDVFVMSSRQEGLGSTVLDAFLEEVPVASTDAGGLAGLVRNRGLVVPTGDASALAQAILRLIDDKTLRAELTAAAKAHVLNKHSVQAMSRAYLDVYRAVT